MKLLSIEDLKKYELSRKALISIMAKEGKLDTSGDEDCYPTVDKPRKKKNEECM
ncbi:hypothetical protein [uncultured Tenacibaculum sp.]|uniref:hypothetical protein n=1 Tax=uncultured Tenacibaculum sp. TaxID=174713 RepID=UPI0026069C81|nr:hypothetical protein [uncultured Tenacibaculum sp.]